MELKVYIVDIEVPLSIAVVAASEDEARASARKSVRAELDAIDACHEAIIGEAKMIIEKWDEWEDSPLYLRQLAQLHRRRVKQRSAVTKEGDK